MKWTSRHIYLYNAVDEAPHRLNYDVKVNGGGGGGLMQFLIEHNQITVS